MTVTKCIQKLLKYKTLVVQKVEFEGDARLTLEVRPYKSGARCPVCLRRCSIIASSKSARFWRDITVAGREVWLKYHPREIQCPTHGRCQEEIPWARPYARVTYRLEYLILRYCQQMTQKAASELLHMPKSTLSDTIHRCVSGIRDGHVIKNVTMLGVDEVSYAKGHKYATIVYDLERGCVLWVGKGKSRAVIDFFFENKLTEKQKSKIRWASCDMCSTFIGAITDHCKEATLVLDHFHVVKALIKAVDQVRMEQWRTAKGDKRKALKGLRWLLYRHSSNRTEEQTKALKALEKGNKRIFRASVLKDEFDLFWDFSNVGDAEDFLKAWITKVMRSKLESLKTFAKTMKKHFNSILAFVESGLTNAKAEGINRVIRLVNNRASGFSNLDAFKDMIFLTVGDLDIPAQIPSKFRTL